MSENDFRFRTNSYCGGVTITTMSVGPGPAVYARVHGKNGVYGKSWDSEYMQGLSPQEAMLILALNSGNLPNEVRKVAEDIEMDVDNGLARGERSIWLADGKISTIGGRIYRVARAQVSPDF